MDWRKHDDEPRRAREEQGLEARRVTQADAHAYYALRLRSCADPDHGAIPEMRVLDELDAVAQDIAGLLESYDHEGTLIWGVTDQDVLAGVLCLSRQIRVECPDEVLLWGIHVLPRYRGTAVSRLLMESAVAWCERQPVHWMTVSVEQGNGHACQYLERFGFERIVVAGEEDARSVVRMRRRI